MGRWFFFLHVNKRNKIQNFVKKMLSVAQQGLFAALSRPRHDKRQIREQYLRLHEKISSKYHSIEV